MSRGKVFFKFRSASSGDFDHVEFPGMFIPLLDLKAAIVAKWDPKALAEGATVDYDLDIVNAESGQQYEGEDERVRKNTAVLVRRVAVSNPRMGGLLSRLRGGGQKKRGYRRRPQKSHHHHNNNNNNNVKEEEESESKKKTEGDDGNDDLLGGDDDIFAGEAAAAEAARAAAEAAAAADEAAALAEMAKLQAQAEQAGGGPRYGSRNITLKMSGGGTGAGASSSGVPGLGSSSSSSSSSSSAGINFMGIGMGVGGEAPAVDTTLPSQRRFAGGGGRGGYQRRGGFAGMRGTRVNANARARSARARAARNAKIEAAKIQQQEGGDGKGGMSGGRRNQPPRDYLCDRCGVPGHYKQDCPNRDKGGDSYQTHRRARKTTGAYCY